MRSVSVSCQSAQGGCVNCSEIQEVELGALADSKQRVLRLSAMCRKLELSCSISATEICKHLTETDHKSQVCSTSLQPSDQPAEQALHNRSGLLALCEGLAKESDDDGRRSLIVACLSNLERQKQQVDLYVRKIRLKLAVLINTCFCVDLGTGKAKTDCI